MQMTAVRYIWNAKDIVKASWSLFQHTCAASLKLSDRSHRVPALSAKNLPWRWTEIWNVNEIRKINRHPAGSGEDTSPERISDTEDWLNSNGDIDNPNVSEADYTAHIESDIEHNHGMKVPESLEQRDASAKPQVPWLIWPTLKSKRHAERVLVAVNTIEMRRNKRVKNM